MCDHRDGTVLHHKGPISRRVSPVMVALALAGCSFSMKTNPERWRPDTPPICDRTMIPPFVDLLLGGLLATISVRALSDDSYESDSLGDAWSKALATVTGVPAIIYLGASSVGFWRAHRCRSAGTKRRQWLDSEAEAVPSE